MMDLRQRAIWITGASSGIGRALALAFHRAGARLVLSARREEVLDEVRRACGDDAEHITVLPLDLSEPQELPAKAQAAFRPHGAIDILVHSAGLSQRSLVHETDLRVDRSLMEVNFFGAVALTKAVLPAMLARRTGHIVVISSLLGKFGMRGRSGYAASKHALHGYFESLRAEVRSAGIAVTLVCPGYVDTDLPLHALTGDGSPHGLRDATHTRAMSATTCATRILESIERRREEVVIGGWETYAVSFKRFLPGLFARAIRRYTPT
jgi:dehydrogenase/reductase SDR family protein 7B